MPSVGSARERARFLRTVWGAATTPKAAPGLRTLRMPLDLNPLAPWIILGAALAVGGAIALVWWFESRQRLPLRDPGPPIGAIEYAVEAADATDQPAMPEAVPEISAPRVLPDRDVQREVAEAILSAQSRERSSPAPSRLAPATPDGTGYLALRHVDLSIGVLRAHLDADARPMPAVWMMLLDLARTHGREDTFRELAGEFHRRFNVRAPLWEAFPPRRREPGLEAYPRLLAEITRAWGTHDCKRILDRLLHDNRGGHRRGFTMNAYSDLVALRRATEAVLASIDTAAGSRPATRPVLRPVPAGPASTPGAPLLDELVSELDIDLRRNVPAQSVLETENPALAGMLQREWGKAALRTRLEDMLERGREATGPISDEACDDLRVVSELMNRLDDERSRATPSTAASRRDSSGSTRRG